MTDNLEQLIKEAVEKALEGDMDAINNIEDRVTRSKAKAALVKAKREAAKEKSEASSDEGSDPPPDSKKIKTSNENIAEKLIQQFPNDINKDLSSETNIQVGIITIRRQILSPNTSPITGAIRCIPSPALVGPRPGSPRRLAS